LPDERERRHQRECLSILEAQVDVDEGRDPMPALATARHEVGEVYRTMRAPWLVAKWLSVVVLAIAAATALSLVVVG
jgi:hypothetical protein